MIVDSHMHVWDEPHPERGHTWTPDPHPVEDLLPVLDANGVQRAVQVTPLLMAYDNDYGVEVAAARPDRIKLVGRFDAAAADAEGRLAAWLARPEAIGVRLTRFGTDSGALDGPALRPFWRAAEALDASVAVFAPDQVDALLTVLERHPSLRLVVDHLGLGVYPGCPDPFAGFPLLRELAAFEQVVAKVSGLVETSAEPFPFRDVHGRLEQALEWLGPSRLMWGSNYPVVVSKCGYTESLRFLDHCTFLGEEDRRALLAGTFASHYGWA